MRLTCLAVLVFSLGTLAAAAGQTVSAPLSVRLPLPVDSPLNAVSFETPVPVGGVVIGFLLPSSGPLTAWAPVWAILQADGSLKESQPGGWVGPRPAKWLKVVRAGFVVGGFRFLVKVGSNAVQTRQAQIFWKPWIDGEARGAVSVSPVYGQAAGSADEVKIIELKLPEGGAPVGLYGQTVGSLVAQISLVVRQPPALPTAAPATGSAPLPPRDPAKVPSGPAVPSVPPVVLSKP